MTDEPRKAWNSKGIKRPMHNVVRSSPEYKRWRAAVLYRDNYTCQKTLMRGVDVVAHHVENFSDKPEKHFALENGVTLTVEAHREFHAKYGKYNNTMAQLKEFLGK